MGLLLLVLACDLTGATAEDPEGQGDGTSDSTPTETPDAGATRPMERWSRWACDDFGSPNEYCAAAFPRFDAPDALIECYRGHHCEYGNWEEAGYCEGTQGRGCNMCENAFRDCFLPWIRSR